MKEFLEVLLWPTWRVPGAAVCGRRGTEGGLPGCRNGSPAGMGGRMRVVRVLGVLEPGGAQLSALMLSAALRRHGVATTFAGR